MDRNVISATRVLRRLCCACNLTAFAATALLLVTSTASAAPPRGITDCNNNGVDDAQDIDPSDPDGNGQVSADCNGNLEPDECELTYLTDCNDNDVLDACESLQWTLSQRVDMPVGTDLGDSLALSIARPGKFALGNPDDSTVYVWEGDCESTHPFGETFRVFTGSADSRYGYAIDAQGDSLLVGAPGPLGASGGGASLIDYNCAAPLDEITKSLIPLSPTGEFGHAVGFSTPNGASFYDQYAVGAPGDDYAAQDAGAVFLFHYEYFGPNWFDYEYVQNQQLIASDASAGDRFGAGLAIDGNLLAVTAPDHSGDGAVYIFRLVGDTWTEETMITPADTACGEPFGEHISIDRNRIIVGTPYNTAVQSGDAYGPFVFHFNGSTWVEELAYEPLVPPVVQSGAYLQTGTAVSISNGIAVTSTPIFVDLDQPVPSPRSGFVDIRRRGPGNVWVSDAIIHDPEAGYLEPFGDAVAMNGSHLAITSSSRNAVFLFDRCKSADILGDIDADGDIDIDDANALVAVLLDAPLNPADVDRSDLNNDNDRDGLDIQAFVNLLLGA